MNRRGFFKTVTAFVAGLCAAAVGKVGTSRKMSAKALETKRRYEALMKNIDANEKRVLAQDEDNWKFITAMYNGKDKTALYINGVEIDEGGNAVESLPFVMNWGKDKYRIDRA